MEKTIFERDNVSARRGDFEGRRTFEGRGVPDRRDRRDFDRGRTGEILRDRDQGEEIVWRGDSRASGRNAAGELSRAPGEMSSCESHLRYERLILGYMLTHPEESREYVSILSPEDFYEPSHSRIFEATKRLVEEGRCDGLIAEVSNLLSLSAGREEALNGHPIAAELVECVDVYTWTSRSSSPQPLWWASMVKKNALLRTVVQEASALRRTYEGYLTEETSRKELEEAVRRLRGHVERYASYSAIRERTTRVKLSEEVNGILEGLRKGEEAGLSPHMAAFLSVYKGFRGEVVRLSHDDACRVLGGMLEACSGKMKNLTAILASEREPYAVARLVMSLALAGEPREAREIFLGQIPYSLLRERLKERGIELSGDRSPEIVSLDPVALSEIQASVYVVDSGEPSPWLSALAKEKKALVLAIDLQRAVLEPQLSYQRHREEPSLLASKEPSCEEEEEEFLALGR